MQLLQTGGLGQKLRTRCENIASTFFDNTIFNSRISGNACDHAHELGHSGRANPTCLVIPPDSPAAVSPT